MSSECDILYAEKHKKIQVGAVRSFSSTSAVSSGVHPYLQFKNKRLELKQHIDQTCLCKRYFNQEQTQIHA